MIFSVLEAIEHSADPALRLVAQTAGDRDVERRPMLDHVWGRRFAACGPSANHDVWTEGEMALGDHAIPFGAYAGVIDENLPYDGHRGVVFVVAPNDGAPQVAPMRLLIDDAPFERGSAGFAECL